MSKKNIITVSDLAIKEFQRVLKETNNKNILFSIKGGGCNGFEYELIPNNLDLLKKNELFQKNGVNIHICNKSLFYILGTHIDWKNDIIEKKFIFKNPMAKSSCGCGTSFNTL
jgi:iron-sulfur cluster assembly accessory protein|tara:strand:- start:695 stop:1033 length:339 start_codon:yes stop_codon:yes gene_type:complete